MSDAVTRTLIDALKATKQSIIHNKWGRGYSEHCAQWHFQNVNGFAYKPVLCGCGIESFMANSGYSTDNIFVYNDTHTKWDMIALLGKFIRHLEAKEVAHVQNPV